MPDDFSNFSSTTGSLSVGGTIAGNIEISYDADWFRIQLVTGTSYRFDLEGVDTGRGTLPDPFLILHNGHNLLSEVYDDDSGTGRNSSFTFTPTLDGFYEPSGTYYLDVHDYNSGTGTYRLSATALNAPVSAVSTYTLTPGPQTVQESDGTVVFTLSRSPGGGTETVYFYVSDGGDGHRAGDDGYYYPGSVTFFPGDTSRTLTFDIDDSAVEPDETFEILAYRTFQLDPYVRPGTILARTTLTVIDDDRAGAELRTADLIDAAYLSNAAYLNGNINGVDQTAILNLTGQHKWRYVDPTALYSNATVVDGYFSNDHTQALLAFNSDSNTLAIAFRGTEGPGSGDIVDDGSRDFTALYEDTAKAFVDSVVAHASNFLMPNGSSVSASRILITGHSQGGALTEAAMAHNSRNESLIGVTFGSPGVNERSGLTGVSDISERLVNIGHSELPGRHIDLFESLQILRLEGDPIFRITFREIERGVPLLVDLPDKPDDSLTSVAIGDRGQHAMTLYQASATLIANMADSFHVDFRDFTYVFGTDPARTDLYGTSGANIIVGDRGPDTLHGLGGNDILVGNDGVGDVAVYSGVGSDYRLTTGANGRTLTDSIAGRDGSDTLSGIERLQFSNGTLAFDNLRTDTAGQAYLLYRAAFDRAPDPDGLGYWIRRLESGADYVSELAARFIDSPEFIAKYGNSTSNTQFLNLVYQNVFDRTPDAGGLNYWLNEAGGGGLNGGYSRANLIGAVALQDENYNAVSPLISDGIWFT
ncbi:MAG: DUF4214 domain-containing protein [Acidimicrobiales bacterium]